jgi:hypothetical protein
MAALPTAMEMDFKEATIMELMVVLVIKGTITLLRTTLIQEGTNSKEAIIRRLLKWFRKVP